MGKSTGKITNWPEYNKALKQRGSVTFWIEDSVKSDWYNKKQSGGRGRSNRNSATVALHNNSLGDWRADNDYHKRSLAEVAMYHWKQLIGEEVKLQSD